MIHGFGCAADVEIEQHEKCGRGYGTQLLLAWFRVDAVDLDLRARRDRRRARTRTLWRAEPAQEEFGLAIVPEEDLK